MLSRTYNSLGLLDDDNGDNWRESTQRTVAGLTGAIGTAGSTITRTDWDGSRQVFTWDAAQSAYVFKDSAGSFDKLTFNSGAYGWTWTDGDSRMTEFYDGGNGGRILSSLDADGKGQTFTYTGAQLTRITDSNGEYVVLAWSGSNLTQLSTYKSDDTLLTSRVRYGYDGSNRLTTVTVDLSPSDNSIADGQTVVYTYTYDGTSKRVASISESGSNAMVAFAYDQTTFKVTQVTETAASRSMRTYGLDYSVANRLRVTDAQSQGTDYFYEASGRMTSVAYGRVLVREETQNGVIGPRQLYYSFAGKRIRDVGNNGPAPSPVDYGSNLQRAALARQPALPQWSPGRFGQFRRELPGDQRRLSWRDGNHLYRAEGRHALRGRPRAVGRPGDVVPDCRGQRASPPRASSPPVSG